VDGNPRWVVHAPGLRHGRAVDGTCDQQWVFTLSAIAVIEEAQVSPAANVLAFLFFGLLAQSLVLAPILVSAAAPTQSAKLLDAAQSWLERHNRVIVIAVSLIFGLWFLWKGISGLLG